ncbi:MAG: DUF58 domain-containing protein [Candidatus Omnitrophica bacterium]|nr:DUF58 domain-containing protein [Candidatus Omnitrophota bacterium]
MIPPEILKQVRRIEILTNRLVNDTMAGRYSSVFKGHGIEFEEVREYQPGDDIRAIDWNVTARTGRPFIKRFVEERELSVMFLVDLSRSMAFGSSRALKQRAATELCSLLAFSAIKNLDKVGLLLFTDRVERFIPPKKGRRHVLRLIREVLSFSPSGDGTDIADALQYLGRITHRKTVAFLLSDFFCDDLHTPLSIAGRRHDLIAVHLIDPRETRLPPLGWVRFDDAETGEPITLDASRSDIRDDYAQASVDHQARVAGMMRAAGVDLVTVYTDQPYLEPFLRLFARRAARR